MIRRILIVVLAVAAVYAGPSVVQAEASITCPFKFVGTAIPNSSTVAFSWGAKCSNAQWQAQFQVQYESGGVWHTADCVNTHPCAATRPMTGWFPSESNQGGSITFDVINTNGCLQRWRALMFLVGKGGMTLGPFAGQASSVC